MPMALPGSLRPCTVQEGDARQELQVNYNESQHTSQET